MKPSHWLLLPALLLVPLPTISQESVSTEQKEHLECASLKSNERYWAECVARVEERSDVPDCGAATFWQTRTREDPMTDKKSCYVSPTIYDETNGGLAVLITGSGIGFTTLGDEYPGSSRKIRVDKNLPFAFEDFATGADAAALMTQLTNGRSVTTEFKDWPYNVARHRKLPVCDLLQKIQSCKESISR